MWDRMWQFKLGFNDFYSYRPTQWCGDSKAGSAVFIPKRKKFKPSKRR